MAVARQGSSRGGAARLEAESRPAFDFFEGFAVTSVLASLEMAGLLEGLERGGGDGLQRDWGDRLQRGPGGAAPQAQARDGALPAADGELLEATLDYLARRGVVRRRGGRFELTGLGRAVCRDKGYLVWLAGGYAEPLRHLATFLRGERRYGTDHCRDGRWVARGAALLGARDVAPRAMDLLETISFERALDLGCGNARFLASVCRAFGCAGVGVDNSPEACEEARSTVGAAGLAERIEVVEADALDLDAVPLLGHTQLVITFFLLHEISSQSRAALVAFLQRLTALLPDGAYLLAAEAVPPGAAEPAGERFTPEFTFVHAMMRQSLLGQEEWRAVLGEGGFAVERLVELDMPGGILLLARAGGP